MALPWMPKGEKTLERKMYSFFFPIFFSHFLLGKKGENLLVSVPFCVSDRLDCKIVCKLG